MFFEKNFKYIAILPVALILIVLTILPLIELLRMSVSEVSYIDGIINYKYIGFGHLNTMLNDFIVPIALKNTLIFVIAVVLVETILGFLLAYYVSRTNFLSTYYRSVIIIPLLIPPVAIGTMWSLMYDYNYGIITQILFYLGVEEPPLWTADPDIALISVIIVDVWHWTSFIFLIMLASIESIPKEYIEAANVDGANETNIMFKITIPMIAPTIIIAMMLRTILAFKVFDEIYVLTSGGPGTSTQVISMYIYSVFSEETRFGYASFLSLVVGILMTIFVYVYLKINKKYK